MATKPVDYSDSIIGAALIVGGAILIATAVIGVQLNDVEDRVEKVRFAVEDAGQAIRYNNGDAYLNSTIDAGLRRIECAIDKEKCQKPADRVPCEDGGVVTIYGYGNFRYCASGCCR